MIDYFIINGNKNQMFKTPSKWDGNYYMFTFATFFSAALMIVLTPLHAQEDIKVLAFAGSTRIGSYNQLLVKEAAGMAQQMGAKVKVIDLKDYPMPFFDADLEAQKGMPNKAKELRQLMVQSHVIFIASPEYNASVSAVLKNALDWASRGEEGGASRDAFTGKQFVLLSASPGRGGGARGLVHLQAIIEDVGGAAFPKKFSLPAAYQAFNDQGLLTDSNRRAELQQFVQQALKKGN